MSTATLSYTDTYTDADVARVMSCFAADYDMVRESCGLHGDTDFADKIVLDVETLAVNGYLSRVDVALNDRHGRELRAAAYTPSTAAAGWTAQRPGGCVWPRTPDGALLVVVSYSSRWAALGPRGQSIFRQRHLRLDWSPSSMDLSHPGLSGTADRLYASAAYGMSRVSYT
jgi:hypothetical protein